MSLDPLHVDVYVDVETVPTRTPPEPWWPDYPPEIPYFEAWLETQQRPHVRAESEVKAGNRKGDKRAEYIAEQIAKDREAAAAWDREVRDRYNAEQEARAERLEQLRLTSALDPFLGGQIACIGIAVGGAGSIKVISPDNDPAEPAPSTVDGATSKPEEIAQRAWLRRHREYRLLKRLSQGLQRAATHGLEEGRSRRVRLIAWNGYRFDFQALALRAAVRAREVRDACEPVAPASDLDERGLDRDLLYLVASCWHGVHWKAEQTKRWHDPRVTWAFGDSPRWVRGKLPDVARFLGFTYTDEQLGLLEIDHADIPAMLEGGPAERARAHAVCALDVELLRFVHEAMLDLGVGA